MKASLDELSTSEKERDVREDGDVLQDIDSISQALDAVYQSRNGGPRGAEDGFSRKVAHYNQSEPSLADAHNKLEHHPAFVDGQRSQVLAKAADFDARLTFLEASLGLTGTSMPDAAPDSFTTVLPSLASLERSIQLATGQPGAIDLAQSKARQLLKDADKLQRSRPEGGDTNAEAESTPTIQPEQVSKINALYGLLPTIDSISPTLPLVLDRLRTLQLLHTNAADASTMLDELVKRNEDQDDEIKAWREALEKVEDNLKENETILAENMEKMGTWVRDLESKVVKNS